jgi:hypothetical protein
MGPYISFGGLMSDRALPLAIFPPVQWWLKALEPGVKLDLYRPYRKQTLRNRYYLLTANGVKGLTVPVQSTQGISTSMREIRLSDGKWRSEHLHAIRSAYGRAAYFEYYYPQLETVFQPQFTYLHEMSEQALSLMTPMIGKRKVNLEWMNNAILPDELATRALELHLDPHYNGAPEPSYPQVFSDRFPFVSQLSCIDLLMNKGPQAIDYILFIKNS